MTEKLTFQIKLEGDPSSSIEISATELSKLLLEGLSLEECNELARVFEEEHDFIDFIQDLMLKYY